MDLCALIKGQSSAQTACRPALSYAATWSLGFGLIVVVQLKHLATRTFMGGKNNKLTGKDLVTRRTPTTWNLPETGVHPGIWLNVKLMMNQCPKMARYVLCIQFTPFNCQVVMPGCPWLHFHWNWPMSTSATSEPRLALNSLNLILMIEGCSVTIVLNTLTE